MRVHDRSGHQLRRLDARETEHQSLIASALLGRCLAFGGTRINTLGDKITVILVAHDMDLVFGVAQRIMVLHYGEIVIDGPCDQVRVDPKVKEIYMGAAKFSC